MSTRTDTGTRPVSIPHLVFAVVFLGIAAVKFIGEATNADLPRSAIGFPVVLIGAGIVGLVATLINAGRRSRAAYQPEAFEAAEPETTDETAVIDRGPESTIVIENEDKS